MGFGTLRNKQNHQIVRLSVVLIWLMFSPLGPADKVFDVISAAYEYKPTVMLRLLLMAILLKVFNEINCVILMLVSSVSACSSLSIPLYVLPPEAKGSLGPEHELRLSVAEMVSTSCAKRVPTDSWCTCSQSKT